MKAVQLVVTCTQRKRLPATQHLSVRSLPKGSPERRVRTWVERLSSDAGPRAAALDLYCGDTWAVVKRCLGAAKKAGYEPTLWVCSAGYGLVSAHAQLAGYAATFAPDQDDSITRAGDSAARLREAEEWWGALTSWRGPESGDPRSLTELARLSPRTPLLFAASDSYLSAMGPDLTEARKVIGDRLLVISAGSQPREGLEASQLPCDGRFQTLVGGARQSINVRILKWLLEKARDISLDVDSATMLLVKAAQNLDPLPKFDRAPMTDQEVLSFIQRERDLGGDLRHTPLLRKLRDSGHRCEQKRFKAIYQLEVSEHGS